MTSGRANESENYYFLSKIFQVVIYLQLLDFVLKLGRGLLVKEALPTLRGPLRSAGGRLCLDNGAAELLVKGPVDRALAQYLGV